MTQGFEANKSGRFLERIIADEFTARGVPVVEYERNRYTDIFAPVRVIRNMPYINAYGGTGRSEFVYRSPTHEIRIECKWQETVGSVDEKLHFTFHSLVKAPEPEIWLVLDGGGHKDIAISWLKREAGRCETKIVKVLSLGEARSLIRRLCREPDSYGSGSAGAGSEQESLL